MIVQMSYESKIFAKKDLDHLFCFKIIFVHVSKLKN